MLPCCWFSFPPANFCCIVNAMVALLKTEQQDDIEQKEYFEMQLDTADDKNKGLERTEGKLTAAIAEGKDTIAVLTE